MKFIETTRGAFINVEHIKQFRRSKDAEGNDEYVCLDAQGEEIGRAQYIDVLKLREEFIPNTRSDVTWVEFANIDGEDGTKTFEATRLPIVAWRINQGFALPVTVSLDESDVPQRGVLRAIEYKCARGTLSSWYFFDDDATYVGDEADIVRRARELLDDEDR